MSNKLPYVQMRYLFEDLLNYQLFSEEAKTRHGWNKDDFLAFLQEEMVAAADEETYDITIEAPYDLQ